MSIRTSNEPALPGLACEAAGTSGIDGHMAITEGNTASLCCWHCERASVGNRVWESAGADGHEEDGGEDGEGLHFDGLKG